MDEVRVGRYRHAESKTEWQVVEWGTPERQKNIDEFRLTRRELERTTYTTFAITYPNGDVRHLSFAGNLPTDLDTLADYWIENESL